MIIDKDLVFNDEVEIKPGTIFLIKPDKHIIFKQRILSEGTKQQPIIFKKYDKKDKPWGSVAILGKKLMVVDLITLFLTGEVGDNLISLNLPLCFQYITLRI